jgi:hypothetical protein
VAVKPQTRFRDGRCIDRFFDVVPAKLHHFSWARTDEEVERKITHYHHSNDFDTERWYKDVWLDWEEGKGNLHPINPEDLKEAKPAQLPKELERLNLWPK